MEGATGSDAPPAGPDSSPTPPLPDPFSSPASQAQAGSTSDMQHNGIEQHPRKTSLPRDLTRRFSSMHFWLQDRPTGDEDVSASLRGTQSVVTSSAAAEAGLPEAHEDGSEAGSDGFGEWAPGSPDLHQGLLQHSRHSQHKWRQQRSRFSNQPQHSRMGGGLLAGLFGSRTRQHDDEPVDAAAATADLLESGCNLTFDAHTLARTRQQESAAATAAGTAAATLQSIPSSSDCMPDATPAADPAFSFTDAPDTRCFSSPAAAMPAEAAKSGLLNEDVFDGQFGQLGQDVAAAGSTLRRSTQSVTLGQMSRGKSRWQTAAHKVLAMKHITSSYRPGALQGLDVKRHSYDSWFAALHTDVNITIVDYNKDQVEVAADITNAMLPEVLKVARPAWSKVRWINVQGLSWDVITTLAVAYDLHPLSVEDIVHIPQRIKADYYPEYLYTSVILLSVDHPSHLADQPNSPTAAAAAAAAAAAGGSKLPLRRTTSTARRNDTSNTAARGGAGGGGAEAPFGGAMSKLLRTQLFGAAGAKKRQVEQRAAGAACPAALQPMQPMVEQASLFLFRDGTLITMFQSVEKDTIARRLMSKLKGFRSLLSDSQDASYLFNAVLDAVVDHTLPLVQVYSNRIATLESRVLLEERPRASLTKELHLLSNDLKLLRRTLVPTQHLIQKLQSTHGKDNNQGFLSPLTVLYLSDVYDHISTVVEDMISLAEDAKDLIDLIFNTIAHNNNSSMQMLAVVSTIFLPITFLAGVYGTNFDQWFPEIHWKYGYGYFWGACVLITVMFSALLQRWGLFDNSSTTATNY